MIRQETHVTALSLRRLWSIYKKILADDGMGKRDLMLAQLSFYSGARGVLKVLAYLIEQGEHDALLKVIERHGRQINRLGGRRPRARRH
jgi:hypothetical protein